MTTNYVERLDSALVRPGRVDFRQFVGYATEYQVERMFRRFCSAASDTEVADFVQRIFSFTSERPEISRAKLQGLFLSFTNNPSAVFYGIPSLSKDAAAG